MKRWVPLGTGACLAAGALMFGLLSGTSPAAEKVASDVTAADKSGSTAVRVRSEQAPRLEGDHHAFRQESGFEVVGRNSLFNRGMNAAIAIHEDTAYVGSRTDGGHPNAGVLILDIADHANPAVIGRIDVPEQAREGQTSRELRIWPEKDLLLVLNFHCSSYIHACADLGDKEVTPTIQFFDIRGSKAAEPELIHTYRPAREPHEFYLWDDPRRAGRALLYMSTPDGPDNVLVADISGVRQGKVREVFSGIRIKGEALHSLAVDPRGGRAFLAYLEKGFLVADTTDFVQNRSNPKMRLVTKPRNAADWKGPGAHSAVPIFGTSHALVTDEVYGEFGGLLAGHGCPWGWTRTLDIADPQQPAVSAQYRVFPYNFRNQCDDVGYQRDNFASFSAHNPTLTSNLAFITWHSAGLQAVDIADPTNPTQAGQFLPRPLPHVFTEDPALSSGRDKVAMWSYPIIKDGLIYVVDIRNGLYILRYNGDHAGEVGNIDFLEGNSNLGAARRLAGLR